MADNPLEPTPENEKANELPVELQETDENRLGCDELESMLNEWSKRQDEEALTRLNPHWLRQYPKNERKGAFFHEVLPILALQVDRYQQGNGKTILNSGADPWIDDPDYISFDLLKAVSKYHSDPVKYIRLLSRFVVLTRAQIMYDKLWRLCPEFYLLGLAQSHINNHSVTGDGGTSDSIGMLQEVLQSITEQSSHTSCLPQKRTPGSFSTDDAKRRYDFLESCRKNIEQEQETMPLVPKSPRAIEQDLLNYPEKHLVAAVQAHFDKFHQTFRAIKARLLDGSTGDPREVDLSHSWIQILDLGSPKLPTEETWRGHAVKDKIWEIYMEGPAIDSTAISQDQDLTSGRWQALQINIRSLCQEIGLLATSHDPLRNIKELRNRAAQQLVYTADLHTQLNQLKAKEQKLNRIITSLSVRHVLESLPPPGTTGGASAKWERTWNRLWRKAKASPEGSDNPLARLRSEFPPFGGKDSVDIAGKNVYSTLSINIHGYDEGRAALSIDQWDRHVHKLFMALMPENFHEDGSVDWKAERERLGYNERG